MCGTIHFKSEGRLMVDTVSFFKTNPGYGMDTRKKVDRKSVKEEDLFMCAPSVYGFSFASKKWGQIYIDELSGIIYIFLKKKFIFCFVVCILMISQNFRYNI
jgi:hypothetical protein